MFAQSNPSLTLISSRLASLAKLSLSQESDLVLRTNDGFGLTPSASFAWYDPDGRCWRTSQVCLDGECQRYLETWPQAGTMRNGNVFQRQRLVPRTSGIESGLWHTPQSADSWVPTEISENTMRRGDPRLSWCL